MICLRVAVKRRNRRRRTNRVAQSLAWLGICTERARERKRERERLFFGTKERRGEWKERGSQREGAVSGG